MSRLREVVFIAGFRAVLKYTGEYKNEFYYDREPILYQWFNLYAIPTIYNFKKGRNIEDQRVKNKLAPRNFFSKEQLDELFQDCYGDYREAMKNNYDTFINNPHKVNKSKLWEDFTCDYYTFIDGELVFFTQGDVVPLVDDASFQWYEKSK